MSPRCFRRIALAHPEVHLTYRSGGQGRPRPAAGSGHPRADRGLLRPRAGRVAALGRGPARRHAASGATSPTRRRAGRPPRASFSSWAGRYVRDRSLGHALNEAYRGLLMVGRMPVAFLHLEIPPEEVDVNVHPTKVEVRFRDSQRVYSHLLSTLRQTFLKSDLHARLQASQEPAERSEAARGAPLDAAWAQPARASSGSLFSTQSGSSLGVLELGGGATDRQRVASWFEPPAGKPRIPESVGQPAPRAWAQSLPLGGRRAGRGRSTNSRRRSRPPRRAPCEIARARDAVPSTTDLPTPASPGHGSR